VYEEYRRLNYRLKDTRKAGFMISDTSMVKPEYIKDIRQLSLFDDFEVKAQ
jgi:hypothetical protein